MAIYRRMAHGALWTVSLRLFHRGIGFVSTLILARLLVPEDFGLVAMATVFSHLIAALSDFSVHVPLIQKTHVDREDLDSAWTLQLAVGFTNGAVLFALASPVAVFYEDPRMVEIMYALAGIAILGAGVNIGVVMFQREMTFGRDFAFQAGRRVTMFLVTVPVALIWASYWALLLGMAAGALVGLVLSYAMHPHRPRLCTVRCRELVRFSKWMLATNILTFLGRRAPELILGRAMGPRPVGLFSISHEIAMLPTTELVAPINRVALPGYSAMRGQGDELKAGFLDVAGFIALIALPVAVGIAATAELLIPLLLGAKWLDTIPLIHYLALAGAIASLRTNTGSVILALGRPGLETAQQAVRVGLLVPAIFLGVNLGGVMGVAIAYFWITAFVLVMNLMVVFSLLRISAVTYAGHVYRPVVAALSMYALEIYGLVPWLLSSGGNQVVDALFAVVAGAFAYMAMMWAMWTVAGRPVGAESRLIGIVSEKLDDRAPRISGWLRRQLGP